MTKVPGFSEVLTAITSSLHLSIVENIENTASLYGCSISNHHICLLVKEAVCLNLCILCMLYIYVLQCLCVSAHVLIHTYVIGKEENSSQSV